MAPASAQQMIAALYEGGMTDEQIASAVGVRQPTITRIRNGDIAEPKHSTWTAISTLYLQKQADAATAAPARGEVGRATP